MASSNDWSVAIFAARESAETLAACVRAAVEACAGRNATIDVLINGNRTLAEAIGARRGLGSGGVGVRTWSLALGDKAHTWNEYVHRIWTPGTHAFFVDGYAEVQPGALAALNGRFQQSADVLGATGVPSCGRSAPKLREQMLKTGGVHGNLYAIRAEVMDHLRATGFRLPLGLYRTDPLIGAVLMFGLDPAANKWDPRRIAVEPEASWNVQGISALTWKNITSQAKRVLRQAQGDLENRATREHLSIRRLAPHTLPATARDLVNEWIDAQPEQARALFMKRPLCLHAARKLRQPRDWAAATQSPELIGGAA